MTIISTILDHSKKSHEQEKLVCVIYYLYCNEIYTKIQDEELYRAVERNNISDVQILLKNNANPNNHQTSIYGIKVCKL